jgi:hypothetical protein
MSVVVVVVVCVVAVVIGGALSRLPGARAMKDTDLSYFGRRLVCLFVCLFVSLWPTHPPHSVK